MEWDQVLFKKAWDYIKNRRAPEVDEAAVMRTVKLSDLKDRLTILARMIAGGSNTDDESGHQTKPVEIMKAEAEGGYTGNTFFLPAAYNLNSTTELNTNFYLFRVFYLATQQALGLNWPAGTSFSVEESRQKAKETAPEVLAALFDEFPGMEIIFNELKADQQNLLDPVADDFESRAENAAILFYGKWFTSAIDAKALVDAPRKKSENDNPDSPELPQTEIDAPAKEIVNVINANLKESEEYTLMHSFEKVETIEEFKGTWRDFDGDDELEEHEEALKETNLDTTVRVDDVTHSIYKSEYLRNTFIPFSKSSDRVGYSVPYDEWDYRKSQYLPGHCKVYPAPAGTVDQAYVTTAITEQQPAISRLRKRMQRLYNENHKVRHQLTGEMLDLDRLVDNYADIHAGKTPSELIYIAQRKRHRDISVLILLDLSLSTDGYAGGKRILDVEKKAVIAFGEVLSEFGAHFQIDGFSSRTRNFCDYVNIKRFDENWQKARAKVGGLTPAGYTRIGPAIRHATAQLEKQKSRKKWIIMLSDGKPNDYDKYEGRYGIEDVRQANREAAEKHIHIFTLAIDPSAKHYLPRMFGTSAFNILRRPDDLPEALSQFYTKLTR